MNLKLLASPKYNISDKKHRAFCNLVCIVLQSEMAFGIIRASSGGIPCKALFCPQHGLPVSERCFVWPCLIGNFLLPTKYLSLPKINAFETEKCGCDSSQSSLLRLIHVLWHIPRILKLASIRHFATGWTKLKVRKKDEANAIGSKILRRTGKTVYRRGHNTHASRKARRPFDDASGKS